MINNKKLLLLIPPPALMGSHQRNLEERVCCGEIHSKIYVFEMATFKFTINNRTVHIDAEPEMPVLWVIRDFLKLTGTKYGCGIGQCGACTIHLEGKAVRSCVLPVSAVADKEITTIEGLSQNQIHPVQQAWLEFQVTQCGYCQSGQIMSAVALLKKYPKPTNQDIDSAMQGNICRCGTYQRIKKAIYVASENILYNE